MKYKEFKTGDYIKKTEDDSLYIVGNKRNLVAFFLDEDDGWCLYEHAIEEIRHCYATKNVYGDFVYCTDEEVDKINEELERCNVKFVKEYGCCVPNCILEFKKHNVIKHTIFDHYLILKDIEIIVKNNIPTFRIYSYVDCDITNCHYDYHNWISIDLNKNNVCDYDFDDICLFVESSMDELLENNSKLQKCNIHYNSDIDEYECDVLDGDSDIECRDEHFEPYDFHFLSDKKEPILLKDIKNVADVNTYISNNDIDEKLREYLGINELNDEEFHILMNVLHSEFTINDIRVIKDIQSFYNDSVEEYERTDYIAKNLSEWYKKIKDNFLGIGTGSIDSLFDKLKSDCVYDESLMNIVFLLLKTECVSMDAKTTLKSKQCYRTKNLNIITLLNMYKEYGKLNYGFQTCNDKGAKINYIVYFELPDGKQVSFHTHFNKEDIHGKGFSQYNGKWDRIRYSTFDKLEKFIEDNYDVEKWRDVILEEKEQKRLEKQRKKQEKKKKKREERMSRMNETEI